ncbi:MAG: protease complex subunit PrcB family protein [Deltaproteobacteria bacterium]|nr:protease complex subunit PrcB family protein [Deltaproteobacteria bacterium]
MKIKLFVFILSIVSWTMGCSQSISHSTERAMPEVRILDKGIIGPEPQAHAPSLILVNNLKGLQEVYRNFHTTSFGMATPKLPEINFSTHRGLMVCMGIKPSGGYGLLLLDDYAIIRDNAAEIMLQWIQPEKGAIVPQMLTSPWLLIQIEHGDYKEFIIKDGEGKEILRQPFP